MSCWIPQSVSHFHFKASIRTWQSRRSTTTSPPSRITITSSTASARAAWRTDRWISFLVAWTISKPGWRLTWLATNWVNHGSSPGSAKTPSLDTFNLSIPVNIASCYFSCFNFRQHPWSWGEGVVENSTVGEEYQWQICIQLRFTRTHYKGLRKIKLYGEAASLRVKK